jgi:Tfp pilus assembly PilM family ATPase
MAKAVGLFYDNGGVKAAEVSGSARRMRINRIISAEKLPGEGVAAGENLREFFDRNNLGRENVILCLSGGDVILRRLNLPLSNLRQIERTVKFQAEKFIVDKSLEDIVVDYFIVDQTDSETEIFVLALSKVRLRDKLQILSWAGISPVGVTIDAVALFNLVKAAGALPDEGVAALLELSIESVRIILVRDGRLVFLRSLNVAGMEPGELSERIGRELRTSCLVAGINEPLACVLVAGDAAEGTACQSLARRVGADVFSFNPFTTFPSDTTEEENGGSDDAAAVALGAALKGLKAESVRVDFRKEEFALRSGFDYVRGKLIYFLVALIVLFGMLCAQSYYDAARKKGHLGKIEEEARVYWKKIFPKKQFPANTFDKWIKSDSARRKTDTPAGPRYKSFVEAIRKIASVLPAQQKATIRTITFDQKHVILAGDAEDFIQFELLVSAMRGLAGYKINEKFEKRGRPGRVQRLIFSIELVPQGEAK